MTAVPNLTKTKWPVHITDALGIPSIQGRAGPWHSTGDTTDVAWFHAMCGFLGIEYPGERIRAMQEILTAAGGAWDQRRHSSDVDGMQAGGNVRKEAFEDLWLALHEAGILNSHDEPSPASDALQDSDGGPLPESRWTYQYIRLRQGQPAFRNRLLTAYDHRCAISGSDLVQALEAAHITPHSKHGRMETSNGLLLRADLHTLFDLRLIAVDTSTWTVLVNETIRETVDGAAILGLPLRLPARTHDRPDEQALDAHRRQSGL